MKSTPQSAGPTMPEPSPTVPIPVVTCEPPTSDGPDFDLSMTFAEWTSRQEIEKRFAHAHRRRFGLNNTPEDRRKRDQLAFLASFIVQETVRTLDRWAAPAAPEGGK